VSALSMGQNKIYPALGADTQVCPYNGGDDEKFKNTPISRGVFLGRAK